MNQVFLSPRLTAAANMVRPAARLIDVGTDHAYLPIYLFQKEKISFAAASDIAQGPLERARENTKKYGLAGQIQTILTPGLQGLEVLNATDIVIAGMGGELIVSILEQAPFVQNEDIHLILQPMTKQEVLRKYLSEKGFSLLSEEIVCEDERIYQVILCVYTGKVYSLTPAEQLFGPLLLQKGGELLKKLLEKTKMQLQKSLAGKMQGGIVDRQSGDLLREIEQRLESQKERQ